MPRIPLLFLFCLNASTLFSQRQFPMLVPNQIDSAFLVLDAYEKNKNNEGVRKSLADMDKLLTPVSNDYPMFTGMVQLYQSTYAIEKEKQQMYLGSALKLIRGEQHILVDSFSAQFKQLQVTFNSLGRRKDWLQVDSIYRESLSPYKTPSAYAYSLMNYGVKKLQEKNYILAKNIAEYDHQFMLKETALDMSGKLRRVFNEWLVLKVDLEQWMEMPYDKRFFKIYNQYGVMQPDWSGNKDSDEYLRNKDFKKAFTDVIENLRDLRKEVILDNKYGSATFNKDWRQGYYNIYITILKGFFEWAIRDHRPAPPILPYKRFLLQELLPEEFDAAARLDQKPLVSENDLHILFQNLSELYYIIGNGSEALDMAIRGQNYIGNYKTFTVEEKVAGLIYLYQSAAKANRLDGKLEKAFQQIGLLKKYTTRPDTLSAKTQALFENYCLPRLETVYTLIAAKKNDDATDSLAILVEDLNKMVIVPEEIVYKTKTWTHIQYLAAIQNAKRGKWDLSLIRECMDDLENDRTHLEIFYPAQLLYFKALIAEKKGIDAGILSNLLFYTGRQLQDNFILLTPEERMRLYEQRMNAYFDVYHELLFTGQLEKFPELKEKVIAQSLHLKNALVDGNILPNELLVTSGDPKRIALIESLRKLRQETSLKLQRRKIANYNQNDLKEMKDQVQSMWLQVLDGSGMDSLVKFPEWNKLASKLTAEQVYIETVRYNSSLSDSLSRYGAYVITADRKMQLLNLCREDSLVLLLNDPASSPQTASLSVEGNRGAKIGKTQNSTKKFIKGDKDQLAQLLLPALHKKTGARKNWIMVHDGLLNRISFPALIWQQKYLHEHVSIRQLSGSYVLSQSRPALPSKAKVLLAGGLNYKSDFAGYNKNRLFNSDISWPYLPGTKKEIQELELLFKKAGFNTRVISDNAFPDSTRQMLEQYQLIHLSTHGFYFDTTLAKSYYAKRWDREWIMTEPLFRCGIATSFANNPDTLEVEETDGYLLGYELANTDLRSCYLISLSACETGLGDLRNNMGVDGLSRALKIGGAKHLLISLWKVPDQPTAVFMGIFYKELLNGKKPAEALQATQLLMSKNYDAKDWAAFILVE